MGDFESPLLAAEKGHLGNGYGTISEKTSSSSAYGAHRKRTGNFWTAGGHIVTAVIGSGVLSLAWCMAQLGWITGLAAIFIFSCVTYYTSCLLADCYRVDDPVCGERNTTYSKAVKANLGKTQVLVCGILQYCSLYGAAVGYVITASLSLASVAQEICLHTAQRDSSCQYPGSYFVLLFAVAEIFLSQIPNFSHAWWLSVIAAIMSFSYAIIGLLLSFLKAVDNGMIKGSAWGYSSAAWQDPSKMWSSFRAIGDIAFAYSYAVVLIEIQDTLRSPPAENVTMKKASLLGASVTTMFYVASGGVGYAAFGADAPGNLLASFGESKLYWLVSIANICVVVHLLGAYQVFCQPIFASIEKRLSKKCGDNEFINGEYGMSVPWCGSFSINLFRLFWRTLFVISTAFLAILFPFFNDVLGILGSINFWPLTVYFPIEIYVVNCNVRRWSGKWIFLQILSCICFVVSALAMAGSIEGVITGLQGNGESS
eukprot:TRINITY_DN1796_c0_g1_i1.p1 TRINITY_DN1796_c0_g1~~TRINITY_DN1796_c0_g1_i1.p1  ORF type:complete len:483 (-),score=28.03 TRINITY_DN1796_c0_g1_i1:565-2013(-)